MSLTINGTSSDSLGVVVEAYPSRILPARKQEVFEIVGRNGDFVDMYGSRGTFSFANYTQNYEIYINAETDGLEKQARAVAAWLLNNAPIPSLNEWGYMRLEDSYEPDCYREGYFLGPVDVASTLARFGRCTISFSCKPQKFLKSGETWTTLTTGLNTFTNPTGLFTHPYISFHSLTGPIGLQFDFSGSYRLNVTQAGDYTWNTATGDVYDPNGDINNTILSTSNSWELPWMNNKLTLNPDTGVTFSSASAKLGWWAL